MSNRLADARERLVEALTPVMPGRVNPYRPTTVTAPHIWLDDPSGGPESVGARSTATVARFPIWIAVDGADRSQAAQLDELVSRVVDACDATPNAYVRGWDSRAFPFDVPQSIRGAVVTVAVTINANTLCKPEVNGAAVPPLILEALNG